MIPPFWLWETAVSTEAHYVRVRTQCVKVTLVGLLNRIEKCLMTLLPTCLCRLFLSSKAFVPSLPALLNVRVAVNFRRMADGREWRLPESKVRCLQERKRLNVTRVVVSLNLL